MRCSTVIGGGLAVFKAVEFAAAGEPAFGGMTCPTVFRWRQQGHGRHLTGQQTPVDELPGLRLARSGDGLDVCGSTDGGGVAP